MESPIHIERPKKAKDEHEGFAKLKGELSHEKGVTDPAALAASIGRKKYGAAGMAAKSAAGRAKDSYESANYIIKKVKVPITYQKEGTHRDVKGYATAEVTYWKPGNIIAAEPGTAVSATWPRLDDISKELGFKIWSARWPHLNEIPKLKFAARDCAEVMPVGDARAKDFGPDSVPVKEALKLVKRSLPNATAKEIAEFYNALGEDKTPRYIAEWYVHDMRLVEPRS